MSSDLKEFENLNQNSNTHFRQTDQESGQATVFDRLDVCTLHPLEKLIEGMWLNLLKLYMALANDIISTISPVNCF